MGRGSADISAICSPLSPLSAAWVVLTEPALDSDPAFDLSVHEATMITGSLCYYAALSARMFGLDVSTCEHPGLISEYAHWYLR